MSHRQSPAVSLNIGIPQGLILGPLCSVFSIYCSPLGDSVCLQYHLYADDMQLHLAMDTDNKSVGLSMLHTSTSHIRLWYMQNNVHCAAQTRQVRGLRLFFLVCL